MAQGVYFTYFVYFCLVCISLHVFLVFFNFSFLNCFHLIAFSANSVFIIILAEYIPT